MSCIVLCKIDNVQYMYISVCDSDCVFVCALYVTGHRRSAQLADDSDLSEWPPDSFALLKAKDGCPSDGQFQTVMQAKCYFLKLCTGSVIKDRIVLDHLGYP